MSKNIIIDTSVLLHDPNAVFAFKDNNVIISLRVVNELDEKKLEPGLIGKNARQVARTLLSLCSNSGGFSESIPIPNSGGGRITFYSQPDDNATTDDHLIYLADIMSGIVVTKTKDNYLRIKAHIKGVASEDYKHWQVVEEYTGHTEAYAPPDLIDFIYSGAKVHNYEKVLLSEVFDSTKGLYPNQCLTISTENSNQTALCIIDKRVKTFSLIKTYNGVKAAGIKPLNAEQRYALHLLLDPEIKLVTINGSTGSGKTTMTLSAGVQGACDAIYENVMVTRQEIAVGGERQPWLPGTLEEKQDPWLQGIFHCLNKIAKTHQPKLDMSDDVDKPYKFYIVNDIVSPESLAYIRGCTYDSYIVVTEAQNCHPSILKTVVTRAGKKAKVVLEGDVNQIDCTSPHFLDQYSNGLSVTVDVWKGDDVYGHITLMKNVRSELSLKAEQRYN